MNLSLALTTLLAGLAGPALARGTYAWTCELVDGLLCLVVLYPPVFYRKSRPLLCSDKAQTYLISESTSYRPHLFYNP